MLLLCLLWGIPFFEWRYVPPPEAVAPPPPPPPLVIPAPAPEMPPCRFTGTVTLLRDKKKVAPEGGVVAYIRLVSRSVWKPSRHTYRVYQRSIGDGEYDFSEKVRVVVVNDAIDFVNEEKQEHNVFSATELAFEIPKSTAHSTGTYPFRTPGTYHVQCDIHCYMRLDVLAVQNPFFKQVDANGAFALDPLPTGEYEVVAWERNGAEVSKRVKCSGDTNVTLELTEKTAPTHRHKNGEDCRDDDYRPVIPPRR
jgi:plastocyanin